MTSVIGFVAGIVTASCLATVWLLGKTVLRYGQKSGSRGFYLVRCVVPGKAPICIKQDHFALAEELAYQLATKLDVTVCVFKNGELVYVYYSHSDLKALAE